MYIRSTLSSHDVASAQVPPLLPDPDGTSAQVPPLLPDPDGASVQAPHSVPLIQDVREIAVHRNNVLKDMIKEFEEADILNYRLEFVFIDCRGEVEKGRGSGVMREALSIFWREFYSSLSTGAAEKVPCLRHDYQKPQWQSVARVVVAGFRQEKYFPIMLSRAFIASCLFGEELFPTECHLDSFYNYIAKCECDTLQKCLADEECDPSEDEDVMEVLSVYKCFRVVTKENLEHIVKELAHQELIQRPRYICNSWAPIMSGLKDFTQFQTVANLMQLYEDSRPSPKKVVKLFSVKPSNEAERECVGHLKRFVKSLDDIVLGAFLQFVTGSNIITVTKIEVGFSTESGFARRPVAHTCGPVLVIPSTYQSYSELSEEFSCILRETASWAFNIC